MRQKRRRKPVSYSAQLSDNDNTSVPNVNYQDEAFDMDVEDSEGDFEIADAEMSDVSSIVSVEALDKDDILVAEDMKNIDGNGSELEKMPEELQEKAFYLIRKSLQQIELKFDNGIALKMPRSQNEYTTYQSILVVDYKDGNVPHTNNQEKDSRHVCFIPGCAKDFKVLPSFKYHATNFVHDLKVLLAVLPEQDAVKNLMQQIEPYKHTGSLTVSHVHYMWQGFPTLNIGTLVFGFPVDQPMMSVKSKQKPSVQQPRGVFYNGTYQDETVVKLPSFKLNFQLEHVKFHPSMTSKPFPFEFSHYDNQQSALLPLPHLQSINKETFYLGNCGGTLLTLDVHVGDGSPLIAVGGSPDCNAQVYIGQRSSFQSSIQLWSLSSDCLRFDSVLVFKKGAILRIKFAFDLLVVLFQDGTLALVNTPAQNSSQIAAFTGHIVAQQQCDEGTFMCLDTLEDGTMVAGTSTGKLYIMQVTLNRDIEVKAVLIIHDAAIQCVSLGPLINKQRQVASSSYDGRLMVTDLQNYERSFLCMRASGFLGDVKWVCQCNGIAVALNDYTIKMIFPTEESMSVGDILKGVRLNSMAAAVHSIDILHYKQQEPVIGWSCADGRVGIGHFANALAYRGSDSRNRQHSTQQTLYRMILSDNKVKYVEGGQSVKVNLNNHQPLAEFVPLDCQVSQVKFISLPNQPYLASVSRSGILRIDKLPL